MLYKILDVSPYFTFVARALSEAFEACHIDHVRVSEIHPNDDRCTYILFTAHERESLMPKHFIVYNFEQLTTDKNWDKEPLFERMKRAVAVWDYSQLNVSLLREKGLVHARFLPLGYVQNVFCMLPRMPIPQKTFEVGMIGSESPRRKAIYDALNHKRNWIKNGAWTVAQLGAVYASMRVCINCHYYTGRTILEVTRLLPLIVNGVWVVSERSQDVYYDALFEPIVTFCDIGDVQGICRAVHDVLEMPKDAFDAEINRRRSWVESSMPKFSEAVARLLT